MLFTNLSVSTIVAKVPVRLLQEGPSSVQTMLMKNWTTPMTLVMRRSMLMTNPLLVQLAGVSIPSMKADPEVDLRVAAQFTGVSGWHCSVGAADLYAYCGIRKSSFLILEK